VFIPWVMATPVRFAERCALRACNLPLRCWLCTEHPPCIGFILLLGILHSGSFCFWLQLGLMHPFCTVQFAAVTTTGVVHCKVHCCRALYFVLLHCEHAIAESYFTPSVLADSRCLQMPRLPALATVRGATRLRRLSSHVRRWDPRVGTGFPRSCPIFK
jgi:hypothetical protein